MRIDDWDKLEELGFDLIKEGKWKKGNNVYIRKDHCESCNKPFLSQGISGKYCDRKCSNSKNKSFTIKDIEQLLNKEGYTLLTKKYNNNKQKIEYICPNGHKHYTYINNWKKGYRCGYCSGKYKLYISDIINEIESEGYTIVTKDIKDSKQKLHLKCPNGHNIYVSWDNWKRGFTRCTCETNSSSQEIELYNFLEKYNPIIGERTLLKNSTTNRTLELDIYIPSLNKAIEFNGDYWHCNPNKYNKDYFHKQINLYAHQIWERDKSKEDLCKKEGIDLMIIWENDWNTKKEVCKNTILRWLTK